ncbi:MAG: hypothetical protein ACU0DH_08140 [Paracoccus sp. (in: a-proteobacteria)]|uniref:hypothetical protein n=1 Tax=Paracoccus sp. TaxID=267 RepID=UPI004059383F
MANFFNPSTGTFERGDISSFMSPLANPDQAPARQADRYKGGEITFRTNEQTGQKEAIKTPNREGQWRRTSDLARGEGIERTVRNDRGHPVIDRAYRGTDKVNLPGVGGVSLDMAAQLGFVTRNADGTFSFSSEAGSDRAAVTEGQPQAQPSGDQEAAPSEAETFRISDSGEEAMTALCGTLSQDIQMAAINAVVETGSIDPEMIERMAQRSGADPAELARQIETVHEGFYDAVMDRVGALGVHDADLWGDFINTDSRMGREMQKAVRDMVMHNDPSGFDGLAQRFTQSLDKIDPESVTDALKAAGVPHRKHQDSGQILLTLPGHNELSYREAVKLGLIKVSRA